MVSNYKYEQFVLPDAKKIKSKWLLQSAGTKACVDPHEQLGAVRISAGHRPQPE
jgi:hypothetical protein